MERGNGGSAGGSEGRVAKSTLRQSRRASAYLVWLLPCRHHDEKECSLRKTLQLQYVDNTIRRYACSTGMPSHQTSQHDIYTSLSIFAMDQRMTSTISSPSLESNQAVSIQSARSIASRRRDKPQRSCSLCRRRKYARGSYKFG